MREIQRNYSALIRQARFSRRPVVLGSHGRPRAVLMDIGSFQRLTDKSSSVQKIQWKDVSKFLSSIASQGRQDLSLADFIRHDRRTH